MTRFEIVIISCLADIFISLKEVFNNVFYRVSPIAAAPVKMPNRTISQVNAQSYNICKRFIFFEH